MFKVFGVTNDNEGHEKMEIRTIESPVGDALDIDIDDDRDTEMDIGQIAVDILDCPDAIIIVAPIAWVDPSEIDIGLSRNILTISGVRRESSLYVEANMGVLLRQFARYVHEFGGKNDLVLHGYSAPYIKSLTQIITSENLIGRVHITGCLDISARESLYKKAKAWVFIGAYNTTKTNIALAKTYNLPLVLSDIKSFQNYKNAIKIHPNHTEELAWIFQKIDQKYDFHLPADVVFDDVAILEQYKKILAHNPLFNH